MEKADLPGLSIVSEKRQEHKNKIDIMEDMKND
jgi:hypothetical protein